jgi:GNAT superfamily N-acetyltransferase
MPHNDTIGHIAVRMASARDDATVFNLVEALLTELGEEGEETGALDRQTLDAQLAGGQTRHAAFIAETAGGTPVGVVTVSESFALYATGWYGIINEMYIVPGYRSHGIGRLLLDAVVDFARSRGWRRVDVTAPESNRWSRTRVFYERNGFVFTGPKLKRLLR